jgi:hypothetical protein
VALGDELAPPLAAALGIGVIPVNIIESCLMPGGGIMLGFEGSDEAKKVENKKKPAKTRSTLGIFRPPIAFPWLSSVCWSADAATFERRLKYLHGNECPKSYRRTLSRPRQ